MSMKIDLPEIKTQSNNKNTTIPMKLGDAKLIADLLRKHYKNPRRTMIQEYLSNARDAHRESLQDKKIQITLPTKSNPNLIIRDFGKGMDDDRLLNYFCSYASSSKRDSSDFTGGFGIGSKTAWAYRDNFFIKNWNKQTMTLFEASICDHYEGGLKLIKKEESQEDSGVAIIIPIKLEDIEKCWLDFFLVTAFWENLEVLNLIEDEVVCVSKLLEDEDFIAIKPTYEFEQAFNFGKKIPLLILLDDIIYPIPSEIYNMVSDCFATLSSKNTICLKFKTGELKPTISREDLEVCEQNKQSIQKKILMLVEKIQLKKQKIINRINAASNIEELRDCWMEENKILKTFRQSGLSLNFINLDLINGRVCFKDYSNFLTPDKPLLFFSLNDKNNKLKLNSNSSKWLSLEREEKIYFLPQEMESKIKGGYFDLKSSVQVIKSDYSDPFFSEVKAFLKAESIEMLPVSFKMEDPVEELLNSAVCEYLPVSGSEVWSSKIYSRNRVERHMLIDISAKIIPVSFLIELSKHLSEVRNPGLIIFAPANFLPEKKRWSLEDLKRSDAWNNSLNFLVKTLIKKSILIKNILKNYKLDNLNIVKTWIENPLWAEFPFNYSDVVFSRLESKVSENFLLFLSEHDPNYYDKINRIKILEEEIKDILNRSPEINRFVELIQHHVIPINPAPELVEAIGLIAQLKK